MTQTRKRADTLLVERGLFESRARAQDAIAHGLVTADGKVVAKPSETLADNAVIEATPAHPWVSRGGVKLAGALAHYPIEIEDHICLDVGASTGGFTEVLLSEGAALVFAIDVGTNQLHDSLRGHPRIISMERTDIRNYDGKRLPQRPDVVVIDASFISLKLILPIALQLAAAPMSLLALI
jgi:23S rRNA (cytidine1920-2'-O)/16S rRNA (cytidine1409-2'-O)-methyltransferase